MYRSVGKLLRSLTILVLCGLVGFGDVQRCGQHFEQVDRGAVCGNHFARLEHR